MSLAQILCRFIYARIYNNNGIIVGTFLDNNNQRHGYIKDGNSYRTLDVENATETQAYGINDNGKVVGYYYSGSMGGHGFVFDIATDTYTPVDVPGASRTLAFAINNHDAIAGRYSANGVDHGFIFDGATYKTIDFPGFKMTHVFGINDKGKVVGRYFQDYQDPSGSHGFIFDGINYTVIDFPGIPSATTLYDINESDKIVGVFENAALFGFYATPLPDVPVAKAGGAQTVHAGTVVTLDGSGSYDPNGNYPLSYSWTIKARPDGSTAILSNQDTVNPSFTADVMGDYTIELTVRNSFNIGSAPATVTVSTFNTAPVAAAGSDQAIISLGSLVLLDGSKSYDLDSDLIDYSWNITQKPSGSGATLSDPSASKPTFVADVHGDYIVSLRVTDSWVVSEQDSVTVSFINVKPVADAGGNQSVVVRDTVSLNGNGSTDANGDSLSYKWSMVSRPPDSIATISSTADPITSFVADQPGFYVVSLTVNDGLIDSDPANVNIVAISVQSAAIDALNEAIYLINHLYPESLRNKNLQHALTNKINATISMIDQELYQDAVNKLQNDILDKINGCATSGAPDRNDWVLDCYEQGRIGLQVMRAMNLLGGR
ncbi:MAG: DUF3466 family protein [Nitrospirae bacterium]|nr:DUF3466 family protein [Nitrospirota bacterium]